MSPDRRKHRGPHPKDKSLFADTQMPSLRAAVHDLSLLMTRGYAQNSALKLVGDRYQLTERQRIATTRASCSDQALSRRKRHAIDERDVAGRPLIIDGFNLIVTIEAALSGGVIFCCRDGAVRDLASVHGSYRKVEETIGAIVLIARGLQELRPAAVRWLLDRPVSNSARLAKMILAEGGTSTTPWDVELVKDPDRAIIQSGSIAITSDSHMLDSIEAWLNLGRYLIDTYIPDAWIVDLGHSGSTNDEPIGTG